VSGTFDGVVTEADQVDSAKCDRCQQVFAKRTLIMLRGFWTRWMCPMCWEVAYPSFVELDERWWYGDDGAA
jgi:hypothetical protein